MKRYGHSIPSTGGRPDRPHPGAGTQLQCVRRAVCAINQRGVPPTRRAAWRVPPSALHRRIRDALSCGAESSRHVERAPSAAGPNRWPGRRSPAAAHGRNAELLLPSRVGARGRLAGLFGQYAPTCVGAPGVRAATPRGCGTTGPGTRRRRRTRCGVRIDGGRPNSHCINQIDFCGNHCFSDVPPRHGAFTPAACRTAASSAPRYPRHTRASASGRESIALPRRGSSGPQGSLPPSLQGTTRCSH